MKHYCCPGLVLVIEFVAPIIQFKISKYTYKKFSPKQSLDFWQALKKAIILLYKPVELTRKWNKTEK